MVEKREGVKYVKKQKQDGLNKILLIKRNMNSQEKEYMQTKQLSFLYT